MKYIIFSTHIKNFLQQFIFRFKPYPTQKQNPVFSSSRGIVSILLLFIASVIPLTECLAFETITIQPQVQYNASNQSDILLMRQYFQEASWESTISTKLWARLQPLGISKTRLVNVESSDSIQIDPNTKQLNFDFSNSKLAYALIDCKAYNLIPHIVVGKVPQAALFNVTTDGKRYGISDWNAYEAYAYAFLEFITIENGFPNADFEVGNEVDTNAQPWLTAESLPNASPKMYSEYLKLYTAWANAADRLSNAHPELHFRIGGPAIGPYSFGFGKFNWADQFLSDVVEKKLRMDFFSFHFYGNNQPLVGLAKFGRYPSIDELSKHIHDRMSDLGLAGTPIFFSEWGANYNLHEKSKSGLISGNNIGAAWASRFLLDAAENNIEEGSLLVFRDQLIPNSPDNNWRWSSLLHSDESTAKALYNVATMFNKLPDQRVKTTPVRRNSIGVIASANKSKVAILVFNQNWDFLNSAELAKTTQIQIALKGLPFYASEIKVSKYVVDETNGNPYYITLNNNLNRSSIITAKGLRSIRMPPIPVINESVTLPVADLSPSSVTLWEITAAE